MESGLVIRNLKIDESKESNIVLFNLKIDELKHLLTKINEKF